MVVIETDSQIFLKEKYSKILQLINNKFPEIVSVSVNKNPDLPIHFTSNCHFVTVNFCKKVDLADRYNDGNNDQSFEYLELFVKTMKGNAEIKEEGQYSLFDKESNLYIKVLPAMKTFCIEKIGSEKILDMFPEVYHAAADEIVLKNLVNHVMFDKEVGHSFHEASLVMKSLARFHSVSYAFIHEIGLNTFKMKFPHTKERMMHREGGGYDINTAMIDGTIQKIVALLKESELENRDFAVEKLSKYQYNAFSTMCDIVEQCPLFHVLNHGDVWSSNVLFQVDNNGNLTHAKLVDLQMTRIGSPSLDLSYYFYNSIHTDVREYRLRQLLEIYFSEFTNIANKLDMKFSYTFEDLLEDHGKVGKLGLLYGVYIAAASPLMKQSIDFEGSENWIDDFVKAIHQWLDNNPIERKQVLQEVISMVETFSQFGEI